MPKLVIKSHRPWQMALAIIALSAIIAVFTWLLLDTNHWQVIYNQLRGNITTKELLESNQAFREENNELKGTIVRLQQTTQLDKETAIHLQNELKSLQDEVYRQKRELEFYQGVMDTTRGVSGLDIHGLYVEPLFKPNQYVIKLVLTNVTRSDKLLEGYLELQINGIKDSKKQKLNLSDLVLDENTDFKFELKSFRRVEFNFKLPNEFLAERVLVQVYVGNAKEPPINKIFDWQLN
jgi:hypothetical protein